MEAENGYNSGYTQVGKNNFTDNFALSTLTGSNTTYNLKVNGETKMECKKDLPTQTKITIDAMVQSGESEEFMTTVLYLAKLRSESPMQVYAGMVDTYNEIQDYLGEDTEEED